MLSPAWTIKRALLISLCAAAKQVYPHEFIAMLGVSAPRSRVLSEYIILPAEFGIDHSSIHTELLPFDELIVGIVHSHPSRSMRPSAQDLNTFSRIGKIHLILGYPYDEFHFRAYDPSGVVLPVQVVD